MSCFRIAGKPSANDRSSFWKLSRSESRCGHTGTKDMTVALLLALLPSFPSCFPHYFIKKKISINSAWKCSLMVDTYLTYIGL